MKSRIILALASLCAIVSCTGQKDYLGYVNPNIGTMHSRWFFYTPAALPFGLAKLGPSTDGSYGNEQGWEAVGYDDRHSSIEGFPCFHEFQVGGLMLMPVTGELKTVPGRLEDCSAGYRSAFDRSTEQAMPGFYGVVLDDYGIKVGLTATERVGFQQYEFPSSERGYIIFDVGNRLGESGPVRDAWVRFIDESHIEGAVITEPTYVTKYQEGAVVPMYFHAELSRPADARLCFMRGGEAAEQDEIRGTGACAAVRYDGLAEGEKVLVKLGLSYTGTENARLNLEQEASGIDFDRARDLACARWNSMLGRIEVEGGSEESKVKFYTGLYHALLGRGLASDVNGAFPRNDGGIGQIELDASGKPVHNHYNTDAVWGAYWNLNQLWSLICPEYYNDLIASQLLVYKDAGWLGDGVAASKYVSGVGTNMTSILISGGYNWGIRDYDVDLAYEACLKNEIGSEGRIEGAGKMDVGQFVRLGYSPFDDSIFFGSHVGGSQFSASHTVEYSFSSYAVAGFARQLGKLDDAGKLDWLSRGWERLFDDETGYIRPRTADGFFIDRFDPLESWRGFQEGNAMQYTFFVPHQPHDLIARIGEDKFAARLDSIFTVARNHVFGGGKTLNAFAGLYSPYNHGNQPNLHISWLFSYAGHPELTQKWTRLICDEFYGTDPEHGYGYGQDEDQGQLGAWYVMAAMGLFDVQGGTAPVPEFLIGSPQFDRIVIHLSPMNSNGRKFVIRTLNNSPENYRVESVSVNGKAYDGYAVPSSLIHDGGTMVLNMASE